VSPARPAAGEAARRRRVPLRSRAALGLFVLATAFAGRLPSIAVDVFNHSGAEAAVTAVFNDGSAATRTLPDGSMERFGRALTWHVRTRGARHELQHPGEAFETRTWLGSKLYRFQIEPSGCIFVLAPEQEPPASEFADQPRGYPIGCEEPAARPRGR
jgi:hypothetical protein